MNKKKLLIISDSVTGTSGFGRITRNLATHIHENLEDKIEVSTCGYGSPPSRKLPFHQYAVSDVVKNGWQIPELPEIYSDFCEDGEELTLFFIWDLSRVLWAADPNYCTIPQLQAFIKDAPIKKWIYVPLDAEGVRGKLSHILAYTASKFDRVLAYTQFGTNILDRTFPDKKHDYIYHGIDTSIFYPRDKKQSREKMATDVFKGTLKNKFLVGSVMTNQKRKDMALLFSTVRDLISCGKDAVLWLQTDSLIREWDINALVADFELKGRVAVTMGLTNDELATYYSACDVTILSSLGEGMGYPCIESTYCSTPCFTGNYAGSPELYINKEFLIDPIAFRCESAYLWKRPVYDSADFCAKIMKYHNIKPIVNKELNWSTLWDQWSKWIQNYE